MLHASYVRSRTTTKQYAWHTKKRHYTKEKATECDFCTLLKHPTAQVVAVYEHCSVIKNNFPYDMWDHYGVNDHLMVVPKRHVVSLGDLTPEEQLDCLKAITKYEADGYSIYARAPSNKGKSITHQHTHLIKTDDKRKKFILYLAQPYLRLMR